MSRYIDIGVNLTNKSLIQDLPGVLQRSIEHRVTHLVVTGTTLEESRKAIDLCRLYPDRLICTCGVHPHHASDWNDHYRAELVNLSSNDCVRAIGETGLDFNRNYSPPDRQIEVFHQQLDLAAEVRLPVFTHQRDAHDTFIEILRQYRDRLGKIVVHCFTGSKAALFDCLELDCHIGITGWICDERRGTELQQLVKHIPANRLMVETDAPYLLPRSLDPKPKSRINEPAYLPHIVAQIARYRDEPIGQLAENCLSTTRQFFSI